MIGPKDLMVDIDERIYSLEFFHLSYFQAHTADVEICFAFIQPNLSYKTLRLCNPHCGGGPILCVHDWRVQCIFQWLLSLLFATETKLIFDVLNLFRACWASNRISLVVCVHIAHTTTYTIHQAFNVHQLAFHRKRNNVKLILSSVWLNMPRSHISLFSYPFIYQTAYTCSTLHTHVPHSWKLPHSTKL